MSLMGKGWELVKSAFSKQPGLELEESAKKHVFYTNRNTGTTLVHDLVTIKKNVPYHGVIIEDIPEYCRKQLRDNNYDLDAADMRGWTPLHLAAFLENIALINILIEEGASRLVFSKEGLTPLHLAAIHRKNLAAKALLQKETQIPFVFNKRSKMDMDAFDLSNATSPQTGQSALHIAAETNNVDLINILVDEGAANLQCRDKNGNTPLHLAATAGHHNAVRTLLLQHFKHRITFYPVNKVGQLPGDNGAALVREFIDKVYQSVKFKHHTAFIDNVVNEIYQDIFMPKAPILHLAPFGSAQEDMVTHVQYKMNGLSTLDDIEESKEEEKEVEREESVLSL